MDRLRFGLLFDGNSLERWHLRCLDHLEPVAELAGVIVRPRRRASPSGGGSPLIRWYARRAGLGATLDVTARFADVARVRGPVEPPLDFVLKLGRGPIPAELEPAARHGVWCFEHESGPDLPFFREVYDGHDVTRAALLTVEAGEATVLEEGFFRTERRSYAASRNRVLDGIAAWPARVCGRLQADAGGDSAPAGARAVLPPRGPERRPRLFRFWAAIARRRLEVAWERLFRHPQWNVGVLKAPAGALLAPGASLDDGIEWLPLEGRESFFADPFGIVRDGTLHVLCERYRYRERRGHICSLEYSAGGFTGQPQPAIALPVHMSYPFLIENRDEIYCAPETCEAEEVALFRAIEFPRRWTKAGVLLERFAGLDPTVFRHDGRWWLTCTKRGSLEDVELWVWHASDLLGPWTEHARNPVKTDVRGSRPGGLPFVHDGQLYRPAQDCSRTYGGRVVIQRVTRLTPTEFVEEPAAVLEASADSPFPDGRHTLTPVGDLVLVDGRRTVFVWPALRAFLGIWASDLAGRARRRGR